MSLLLALSASSNLQLEGKSRTVQRVVLTAALTFAVALAGTTREVERVRGATLTAKAALQGQVREIERLLGSLSVRTALNGNVREVERLRGATLSFAAGNLALQGTSRNVARTLSAVVTLNIQRDKGSRRVKPELPPEYRWPQPTLEQPEPLVDVVVQAQIQDVPLPKNPAIALALRKAAEKAVKPEKQVRHKSEKVVKDDKPIIDEDDDDFFFLT